MKKLKILIISRSFAPMISPRSFRTTELVKEFCRQGHEVTLATHYNPKEHDEIIMEYGFTMLHLGPQQRRQFNSNFSLFNRIHYYWMRILGLLIEYPNILLSIQVNRLLRNSKGDYDVLISIAAPHAIHWGVAMANKKIAPVWIADCGDAFMGNHLDRIKKPFYFKYIERWFCRKVDYITIPNMHMANSYYPEFRHKIHEVTQGFDFDETTRALQPFSENKVIKFGFAGAFFEGRASRDPRPFMNYILALQKEFEFHIFTTKTDLIHQYLSDSRVIVHKQMPRLELLKELSTFDFLVNIAYDPATQSPSKLIDYALVKRPILNIYNDQLNDEIKVHILEFFDRIYTNQFLFEAFQKFNIKNVSKQFIDLYEHRMNGSDK